LLFLDEAAVWLTQPNTYTWREKGCPLEVPTSKARGIRARLNLIGCVDYVTRDVTYREVEGNTTGEVIVQFLALLAQQADPACPTVVILDRASVHCCSAVAQQLPTWKEQGLILSFLTPYSPELNLMELEWRHLKFTLLPRRHYETKPQLREAVRGVWGQTA
jgi:transposase